MANKNFNNCYSISDIFLHVYGVSQTLNKETLIYFLLHSIVKQSSEKNGLVIDCSINVLSGVQIKNTSEIDLKLVDLYGSNTLDLKLLFFFFEFCVFL